MAPKDTIGIGFIGAGDIATLHALLERLQGGIVSSGQRRDRAEEAIRRP